ncbi:oxidoreductase [Microbacterium sp. SORGH_AS_0888]|uniref:oxidoreductase n=1 Tax=Microbacterium sp. SORGH_AS_0888 TaxID=3041791 RepID=UPI00278B86C3|nr:oxidoreductase [Microbacterium sp. SORGH_AS_0888]MDQ1128944.1 2-dehydropantoate 2-reductase [Microbacterium sp. SORGH_AS_0888]
MSEDYDTMQSAVVEDRCGARAGVSSVVAVTSVDRVSGAHPRETVAIVGPGAIGTTIAAALHEAGRTPLLCGRSRRDRLELIAGDDVIVVPGPVNTHPETSAAAVDVVFLAVKATQLEAAASSWLPALCRPGTVVCVLENGVEQTSMVAPHLPEGTEAIASVVWFPAQARADGTVLLRGEPRLSVPVSAASQRVVEALGGTRCRAEIAPDFRTLAWRKLLQNAAAGWMALTGRRAGMFTRKDIAELTLSYLRECLAVARAEGAELDDTVPAEILALFQGFPPDMSTSILTDREAGRPLEWDIRNGVISRLGRRHDIPTPISDLVVALLAASSDGPG